MAILDTNGKYYKINLEQSVIENGLIFSWVTIYASQEERQREIAQQEEFNAFIKNIQAKGIDYINLAKNDKLSKEERDNQSFVGYMLVSIADDVLHARYTTRKEIVQIPDTIKDIVSECGYKEEWVTNPIKIDGVLRVNCGAYGGEDVTHEFLYNSLKPSMSKDIQNV